MKAADPCKQVDKASPTQRSSHAYRLESPRIHWQDLTGRGLATTDRWVSTRRGRHLRGRTKVETRPEVALRQALLALGRTWRTNVCVEPGCTPDLLDEESRLAIFVDGCFWHQCPQHGRTRFQGPNAELWRKKMTRNRRNDRRSTRLARKNRLRVLRVWECEVAEDADFVARRAMAALKQLAAEPQSGPERAPRG